ncbi:MAG: hypothetical protein K2F84_05540 [Bacteroidales bacterium]|nr:hypothetical protein [Bacteroidales bacterium]
MATQITLNISAKDKASYRKQLIEEFLKETPGTATSVTEYYYFVETLENGKRIYLKRPTALNKGVDFEVRIEDTQFRLGKYDNIISTGNRPSHDDIKNDLAQKKAENPSEFNRLKILLDKTYRCQSITHEEYSAFSFESGHSIEIIFKSLKWLFIEQDITYWNRSGRAMLYNSLCELW